MEEDASENTYIIMYEYYHRPFQLFGKNISTLCSSLLRPPKIRSTFWNIVLEGEYNYLEANDLLYAYLITLRNFMKDSISQHSLAYWYHIYRRIAPFGNGYIKDPATIAITREIMEAAFQKYGLNHYCSGIAEFSDIHIDEVLSGLFLDDHFKDERDQLLSSPHQIVLKNFNQYDLFNVYSIEHIAHEIWRTGALLRIIGKGAKLLVTHDDPYITDTRTDDLNDLIKIFDQRQINKSNTTAVGVWYEEYFKVKDLLLFPQYNFNHIHKNVVSKLFKALLDMEISKDFAANFDWFSFDLRAYYNNHKQLSSQFYKKYNVSLEAVLLVLGAISLKILAEIISNSQDAIMHAYQRAYSTLVKYKSIIQTVKKHKKKVENIMGITSVDEQEYLKAIDFWTLNERKKQDIDLVYPGPHYIFLLVKDNFYFIDYAWIYRRLYDLFQGIDMKGQYYKAKLLENSFRELNAYLPTNPCRGNDGTSKQIDYSIKIRNILLVIECKAVAKSIGFERGSINAINYRKEKVVIRSIKEAEEKCKWLINHKIGKNYDITSIDYLLPIGVSTFPEYIHTKDNWFWITKNIPRVLTPDELKDLIKSNFDFLNSENLIPNV